MKKLFLFTCLSALALSFNSCSDDDSSSNNNGGETGGTVSFKVDGVQKTFDTVTVNLQSETEEGETWEWYEVTASDAGASTETIYFEIEKGYSGADSFDTFTYTSNNSDFDMDWDNFSANTTSNSSSKLKGSFSGTVQQWSNENQEYTQKAITEGTFNINL